MLHLTLRQLKVFESVARQLSFSRAAEELYLTQPAVSMQIKQLEDNVGLPLFEQMGKKIYLTDAGNELYYYSRGISQQLADMELALDELKGLERGKLNISVVSTANYFAPHLLAKFCQRYSGVTVSLHVSNRETVLKQLADNLTDLAIMGRPPAHLRARGGDRLERGGDRRCDRYNPGQCHGPGRGNRRSGGIHRNPGEPEDSWSGVRRVAQYFTDNLV